MPFALYLLGLAVFAQGTSEFMLSGLVPGIARDLAVSIPAAGSLTSAFAVGMIVGAPLMAILSLRWPRRRALLIFLGVFIAVHVIGALTTDFAVLLMTRVAGALANAGFLAVALATAASIVAPARKGKATAVLLGGVTLACVVGVPAGAVLGQLWGWRSAFWAVVLISLPALVAVLRSVTVTDEPEPSEGARAELRALRRPRLLVVLTLGALVNGATFCTFTYLAPLVTDVTGLGHGWIPVLLALFGIGSFAGVTIGGRIADGHPARLLVIGAVALVAGWALFALLAGQLVAVVVLTLAQGTLSFAVGSTLIARVLYTAAEAPRLGGAFATAAFNVGAAIGPWAGGWAIASGFGYRSPLWVSAALVGVALLVAASAVTARRPLSARVKTAGG
ncbi:Cmx/CmrA family chloramphenicol efflux MFS transporter [Saccharomonospora sp. NPDC006951]